MATAEYHLNRAEDQFYGETRMATDSMQLLALMSIAQSLIDINRELKAASDPLHHKVAAMAPVVEAARKVCELHPRYPDMNWIDTALHQAIDAFDATGEFAETEARMAHEEADAAEGAYERKQMGL
jgi:hypothetical protein